MGQAAGGTRGAGILACHWGAPVGHVAAGKWLEPPAKGQEADKISRKTATIIVMPITYTNHKSLILMHVTEIPTAPKERKTSIP